MDPDRGTWTYEWDGLSRLSRQLDARGIAVRFEYDAFGRLVRRFTKGPSSTDVEMLEASWFYDPATVSGGQSQGVLGAVESSDGYRRDYRYDALLRPFRIVTRLPANDTQMPSGLRSFTMEYGYDRNHGRLKALRYPSGEMVALDYSNLGYALGEAELLNGGVRGKQYRFASSMSPRGQVTDQTFGNCAVEVAQYDKSAGMAVFMSALRPNGTWTPGAACPSATELIRQVAYRHDHLLNLYGQEKNFSGGQVTEAYAYDDLQRITGSSRTWVGAGLPPASEANAYTYDDLGNITSKSDYGSSYQYGDARYPFGGPRSPEAHAAAVVSRACEASFRPSRRREASCC